MRTWAFTFFILTLIAGVVGYTNIAFMLAAFTQYIFYVFAILFIAALGYYILKKSPTALSWSLIFFAVGGVAGVLAFTSFTSAIVYLAKASFFIFLILCIISLAMHGIRKRN